MHITKDAIIDCARQIAQHRNYPLLINGLQPVEDYEVAGKQYKGLQTKLNDELAELREAWQNWQSGNGKTEYHVMHEAADCLYYAFQLEEQTDEHVWPVVYASVRIRLPFAWHERHVEAAALAKYSWRAEKAGNKDESHELALIEAALTAL